MTPDRRFIVCVAVCSMTLSLTANSLHATDSATKKEVLKSGGLPNGNFPWVLQADSAYIPEENPMSAEKIEVGRLPFTSTLAYRRDDTVACASCHNPYHGFADPGEGSKGVDGALGGRKQSDHHQPSSFQKSSFGTGEREDLEAQAQGPLTNPIEMAMPSHDAVVAKVKGIDGYLPYFKKAFGDPKVNYHTYRAGRSLPTREQLFLGTALTTDIKLVIGPAMSASALRGMELFNHKANCKNMPRRVLTSATRAITTSVSAWLVTTLILGVFVISKVESEKGSFQKLPLYAISQRLPHTCTTDPRRR